MLESVPISSARVWVHSAPGRILMRSKSVTTLPDPTLSGTRRTPRILSSCFWDEMGTYADRRLS